MNIDDLERKFKGNIINLIKEQKPDWNIILWENYSDFKVFRITSKTKRCIPFRLIQTKNLDVLINGKICFDLNQIIKTIEEFSEY